MLKIFCALNFFLPSFAYNVRNICHLNFFTINKAIKKGTEQETKIFMTFNLSHQKCKNEKKIQKTNWIKEKNQNVIFFLLLKWPSQTICTFLFYHFVSPWKKKNDKDKINYDDFSLKKKSELLSQFATVAKTFKLIKLAKNLPPCIII